MTGCPMLYRFFPCVSDLFLFIFFSSMVLQNIQHFCLPNQRKIILRYLDALDHAWHKQIPAEDFLRLVMIIKPITDHSRTANSLKCSLELNLFLLIFPACVICGIIK